MENCILFEQIIYFLANVLTWLLIYDTTGFIAVVHLLIFLQYGAFVQILTNAREQKEETKDFDLLVIHNISKILNSNIVILAY